MFCVKPIVEEHEWLHYARILEGSKGTSFTQHPDWLHGYELVPGLLKKVGFLFYDGEEPVACIAGMRLFFGRETHVFASDPVVFKGGPESVTAICKALRSHLRGPIHISSSIQDPSESGLKPARFPRWIYPDPGTGAITLRGKVEEHFDSLPYRVKRSVRKSLLQGVTVERLTREDELPAFYRICKRNAEDRSYRIRPYIMLAGMWRRGLRNGTFTFLVAKHEGRVKGGIWLIETGGMFHYIMGGAMKERPSLQVGFLLQWTAISMSIEKGYDMYNISIGGSRGVEEFKDMFGRVKTSLKSTYVFTGEYRPQR
jgi:hypothetical protein